jgi:peroxiredoxin
MPRRVGARGLLVAVASAFGAAAAIFGSGFGQSPIAVRLFFNRDSCEGISKSTSPRRYVTLTQLQESSALIGRPMAWTALSGGRPVLLVFIKNGCPCSVEFEPYFHRLHEAYGGTVRVFGVIDGDDSTAQQYAVTNSVPYPLIADPDERLIRRFDAKNGGYAALLDAAGVVVGFWPGFSQDAMTDLGHRMSGLAGVGERPIETAGLPKKLTTGCPFDVPSAPDPN